MARELTGREELRMALAERRAAWCAATDPAQIKKTTQEVSIIEQALLREIGSEAGEGAVNGDMDIWYDYEHQAWVVDGRYDRCAHPRGCDCYGTAHAGELADPALRKE